MAHDQSSGHELPEGRDQFQPEENWSKKESKDKLGLEFIII